MRTMTINQLAKATELNSDTIRYYEKFGLISDIQRSQAGYRQYDNRHISRLMFIKKCKQMGYTLKEIKEVLNGEIYEMIQKLYTDSHMNDVEIDNIKEVIQDKLDALERQKKQINDQIYLLSKFIDRLNGDINQQRSDCILKKI